MVNKDEYIIFVNHSMTLKELQYRQHSSTFYDNRTNAKTMTKFTDLIYENLYSP